MMRFLTPALLAVVFVPGTAQDTPAPVGTPTVQGDRITPVQRKRAQALLEQLGSADFEERQDAAKKLEKMGKPIAPLLRKAVRDSEDPELRWQARRLLRRLEGRADDGKLKKESQPRRRSRRTDRNFRLPRRFDDDWARSFEERMQRMQKHLDELMKGSRGRSSFFGPDDWPLRIDPGKGGMQSRSESVKVEVTPDGVRVETESGKGDKKDRKVYTAPDMETLLEKHPELEDKVSGWSSERRTDRKREVFPGLRRRSPFFRGFDDFGFGRPDEFEKRIREQIEKMLERSGRDIDLDRDRAFDWRFRIETPEGVKEFGPKTRRGKIKPPKGGKLEKVEEKVEPEGTGEGPRLGVYLRGELPESVREFLRLDEGVGLWVDRVLEGSLAAKAGLQPGDVVTELGGKPVGSAADVQNALRAAKDEFKVGWIRRGVRKSTTVKK